MTDRGNDTTVMKRMIFGIATRIDLLEFIMHGDIPSSCGAATDGSGESLNQ